MYDSVAYTSCFVRHVWILEHTRVSILLCNSIRPVCMSGRSSTRVRTQCTHSWDRSMNGMHGGGEQQRCSFHDSTMGFHVAMPYRYRYSSTGMAYGMATRNGTRHGTILTILHCHTGSSATLNTGMDCNSGTKNRASSIINPKFKFPGFANIQYSNFVPALQPPTTQHERFVVSF